MKVIHKSEDSKLSLQLKLSDDSLKLFLDATPNERFSMSGADLEKLLRAGAPRASLDSAVLDDIARGFAEGKKCEERRIAKGREPKHGADGRILYLVKRFESKPKYHEVEEEQQRRISFTNLRLFDNIKKGQVVARVYGPKNGEDGVDALGQTISAKVGNACKYSLDKSLKIAAATEGRERFETIVAELDGYLTDDGGKLTVKEELVVPGDLDYRFGSINFVGSVIVQGDVSPGFTINSPKSVTVQGAVRESRISCSHGDVNIKGFLFGGRNSIVVTGGNFYGTVIQEARIEAAGNIEIRKEATDCTMRTEKALLMREGALVGGQVFAVQGIECKQIGNEAATTTVINLCSSVEVSAEYERLLIDIDNHDKAQKLLELHLGPYAKNPTRIELIQGPHREKLLAMAAKLRSVQESSKKLLAKKAQMLQGGKSLVDSRVNIIKEAYPGVIIRSSEKAEFELKERMEGPKSVRFNSEKGTFEIAELKAFERSDETGGKDGKKQSRK